MKHPIDLLRNYMELKQLDAVIVPSADPHQSEYVADHWKLRAYFSGFTGSAGTLIVTAENAALWTDSRYFLQVELECEDTEIVLHKQSIPHAPEHIPWLCDILPENAVIGLDFRQFSKSQVDYLIAHTEPKNIRLQNQEDFGDKIWEDRPNLPNSPVVMHPLEFSGESTASKLQKVQYEIDNHNADYYFFSALDEIAWLFNIRSQDVDFTPLVTAYAFVGKTKTLLFCDKKRFSKEAIETLSMLDVIVENYATTFDKLPVITKGKTIITDAKSMNYAVFKSSLGKWVFQNSIVKELKAIKNNTEIDGAKECMIKDGVALTQFFIWLEKELKQHNISEYEIGQKLENFRKLQDHYIGESFAAIVGYKGNGAIIHYTAPEKGSAMVSQNGIILIDSGAQYKNGTTDITRTLWLGGEVPQKIKTAYTSVLKGYIELEQLQFPLGTSGVQLDAFARMHLWKNGLNYPHGTGHGIGSFGMVHEPEQGFATGVTTSRGTTKHLSNQLTTIEPGCYVTNEFGIRIENIVISKTVRETDFGKFLEFKPLTLCYIDVQLIDELMLTTIEKEWLNNYHQQVVTKLSPHLNEQEVLWLKTKCKPI